MNTPVKMTIEQQRAELRKMSKDRLVTLCMTAQAVIEEDFDKACRLLSAGPVEDGSFEFRLTMPHMAAAMIGWSLGNSLAGCENFRTIDLRIGSDNPELVSVVVQKHGKKTPTMLLAEQKAEIAKLKEQLQQERADWSRT